MKPFWTSLDEQNQPKSLEALLLSSSPSNNLFFLLLLIILYFVLPLVVYLVFFPSSMLFWRLALFFQRHFVLHSLSPALFDTLIASQTNSGGLWKDVNYFNWWFIPHKINQFLFLSCQSIEVCRALQSLPSSGCRFIDSPLLWVVLLREPSRTRRLNEHQAHAGEGEKNRSIN